MAPVQKGNHKEHFISISLVVKFAVEPCKSHREALWCGFIHFLRPWAVKGLEAEPALCGLVDDQLEVYSWCGYAAATLVLLVPTLVYGHRNNVPNISPISFAVNWKPSAMNSWL